MTLVLQLAACEPVAAVLFPTAPAFPPSAPRGPEETCVQACETRAAHCAKDDCARGCNLVLDRLVEGEGQHVLECVAGATPRCDEHTWAACASRIGPHADGGPPAPAPPPGAEGAMRDQLENITTSSQTIGRSKEVRFHHASGASQLLVASTESTY